MVTLARRRRAALTVTDELGVSLSIPIVMKWLPINRLFSNTASSPRI
jgi:hypothetical protein